MLNDLRRSDGRIPDLREACKEVHRAEARVPFAARVSSMAAFGVLSLAGILAYGFAPLLVAFFVPGDAEVIAEGARFIRIMCLAWGASVFSSVWWRPSGRLATC